MAGDEGMTKKKKKKGRPSLLELQKRSLKQQQRQQQQQQQQIPNSQHSNLLRRNPNSDADDGDDRKQKKHRLLLGLNSSPSFGSTLNDDSDAAPKRRKIAAGEKFSTATETLHVSPVVSGPTTAPLPDKKLLIFILDRLQKKDTYGVFSEPVDSNELPDYREIIGNPMDFGTVRKKLDDGAYRSLEHFEKDVFLICSNAMEYNSPDTIYFRQARVMQEMAKKDFENLRQDSDDDSEPQIPAQPKVARRGRPPGKNLKKALESPSFDQVAPEFSSDVALPNGGESVSLLGSYNLRKGPSSYRFRPSDSIVKPSYGSATNETYSTWLSEVENEFPASVVKAVMRYGMKHFAVDENRRNTYKPLTPGYDECISTIMDREWKQLVPVGLNAENSYLTSLGRFSADLGPAVWKVASKKTASSLHPGSKLGPGLVSDNKTVEQQQQQLSSLNESPCEVHSRRLLSPEVTGSSPSPFSITAMHDGENAETVGLDNHQTEWPLLHNQGGETQALVTCQFQRGSLANPGSDGYGRGIGMDSSHTGSTAVTPNSKHTPYQVFGAGVANNATICSVNGNNYDEKCIDSSSRLHCGNGLGPGADSGSPTTWDSRLVDRQQQWQGFLLHNRAEVKPFVKEENARLGGMGSPSSSMQMGSPQQPDLALQL